MRQKTRAGALFLVAGLLAVSPGLAQNINTMAGNGSPGNSGDGAGATSAEIDTVYGVAVDAHGNTYLADSRNHRVRKIANGIITTVAGTGQEGFSGDGGAATSAQLSFPRAVAVDAAGTVYLADTGNNRIRKVTPAGVISTLAGSDAAGFAGDGGPAASAQLSYPSGLAVDTAGNLYVADSWNYRIRKISADGKIQTIVGNGSYGPFGDGGLATAASLGLIQGLAVDTAGNLYLSDTYNHRVRKVAGGAITSVVGGGFGPAADGGAAAAANLKFPEGVAMDLTGNLFVADSLNHRVRKVSTDGVISTVAGSGAAGYGGDGGVATVAQLNNPHALATDPNGLLAVSDLWNYRVRSLGGLPVAPPVAPVISAVKDAASGQAAIAAGSYVAIYGTNLAPLTKDWGGAIVNRQLPTMLEGVSVSVGGKPAYVYYISPGQINIVAPDVSAGTVQVTVNNGGASSAAFSVAAQAYTPAFFLWGQYAVATHADYTLCVKAGQFPGAATVPAKPGEWIILWGSGFGRSDAPGGALTPGDKAYVSGAVTATVGGVNAPVYAGSAALAAGYAGLWQVSIQVPAATAEGDAKVRVTVGGVQSADNVFLTVKR